MAALFFLFELRVLAGLFYIKNLLNSFYGYFINFLLFLRVHSNLIYCKCLLLFCTNEFLFIFDCIGGDTFSVYMFYCDCPLS